ncbi:MAG: PIN domain-containing protein [Bacteroidaceae bacterium]|nr:PIN domain-containing protein [Bacteroidaceae bacterium]
MKRIFIDTNVMIDLLARRTPFYEEAKLIFSLVDIGRYTAVIAPISFSTAAYLLGRKLSFEELSKQLRDFSSIVEIANIDERIVRKSLSVSSQFHDIEDAMQHYAAMQADCNCIITRNIKDFIHSDIPVYTPKEFLNKEIG